MKLWLLFITSLIIGLSLSTGYLLWSSKKVPKTEITKEINTVKKEEFSLLSPPKASLIGQITMLSGEVNWQSRTATDTAEITIPQPMQQGEYIDTGKNGKATISFPPIGEFTLSSLSTLSVIQAMPESFVLEQTQGTVRYSTVSDKLISLNTHRILLTIQGEALISIDEIERFITVNVTKGEVTAGYNDSDAISTVQKVSAGETFIFDNERRRGIFN